MIFKQFEVLVYKEYHWKRYGVISPSDWWDAELQPFPLERENPAQARQKFLANVMFYENIGTVRFQKEKIPRKSMHCKNRPIDLLWFYTCSFAVDAPSLGHYWNTILVAKSSFHTRELNSHRFGHPAKSGVAWTLFFTTKPTFPKTHQGAQNWVIQNPCFKRVPLQKKWSKKNPVVGEIQNISYFHIKNLAQGSAKRSSLDLLLYKLQLIK